MRDELFLTWAQSGAISNRGVSRTLQQEFDFLQAMNNISGQSDYRVWFANYCKGDIIKHYEASMHLLKKRSNTTKQVKTCRKGILQFSTGTLVRFHNPFFNS